MLIIGLLLYRRYFKLNLHLEMESQRIEILVISMVQVTLLHLTDAGHQYVLMFVRLLQNLSPNALHYSMTVCLMFNFLNVTNV